MTKEESQLVVPFFEDLNSHMDESPEIEEQLLEELMKSENLSIKIGILMRRLYNAIEGMSKITIAAINGPCNGGGRRYRTVLISGSWWEPKGLPSDNRRYWSHNC